VGLRNVAASVRQRLLDRARAQGEDFQVLLTQYVSERFLYRLGRSPQRDRFVVKGATLFRLWDPDQSRVTRDLDLLSRGTASAAALRIELLEILDSAEADDGVAFDPDSLREAGLVAEEGSPRAIRVTLRALLDGARITLQIDVGFGDEVVPPPHIAEFPVLLEFPRPRVLAYPREAVVAEKFHAMVTHGIANSRMKDFYDVWFLGQRQKFEGPLLSRSIAGSFANRRTPLPLTPPVALTPAFADDSVKRNQWRAFIVAGGIRGAPPDLREVVVAITAFLQPLIDAVNRGESFDKTWPPGGPWQPPTSTPSASHTPRG
jgi:hypothetical protein